MCLKKIIALRKQSNFRKYFANTSWILGERILRMGVSLFVGIYVARYLGPERFGLLSYASSFVGIFVACNSFQSAYSAYQAFIGPSNVMFVISYFVVVVNSSVNSVAYGIFSKKYREVFFEHFFCKKSVQAKIQMRPVITKN